MTSTFTPTADIPAAVGQFQRAPEPEIRYTFWARLADSWAGWRDRRVVAVAEGEAASPWLQRHHFTCVNRLEAEHRTAQASLALLDHALVSERERISAASAALNEATDARVRLSGEPLSDAPTTVAEASDDPAVRFDRRRRDRAAELGRRDARASELRATANAARLAIQTLTVDRHAHWAVLQVRGAHLIAYYNRRAATYVRVATRKHGELVRTPTVPEPTWLGQAVPPAPQTTQEG